MFYQIGLGCQNTPFYYLRVRRRLHFFECHLGFCTKGKLNMFFLLNQDETLLFCHPLGNRITQRSLQLSQGSVMQVLIFATLARPKLVDQLLCPEADRVVHW